ncbi:hypothetical protein E1A91_D13G201000v1 [Gossypium mustelinum]|uniref:Response regulatory domain-containing protein n=1 Tax=Gossypium mustelinum TaxID=34275 RepID=A0A5D2S5K5_GOSMU|nr:hypothetical protein E1A91_D13G201000v1 [Gossypium mustelinum]
MFRNKNLSVPIVDDCRLTQRFYEMHIKKFGVKVQADENGKQAVDLFRSGTSFNLNIKDQDMPVMDGLEATKQLRGMGVNLLGRNRTTETKRKHNRCSFSPYNSCQKLWQAQ